MVSDPSPVSDQPDPEPREECGVFGVWAPGEEVAKLDALDRAYLPSALEGDDKAALIVLRLMERRARLLAIDAPQRTELRVGVIDPEAERQEALELVERCWHRT